MAYDSIDPIGGDRMDILMAILSSICANQFRGKNSDAVTPADILKTLPWTRKPTRQNNAAAITAKMQAWAAAHNAQEEKRQWRNQRQSEHLR